jgi:hypothetical protein
MGKGMIDHRNEMDMLRLRGEQAHDEALWRMEEVEIKANMADISEARKPHKSFGIELLDKANDADGVIWRWSMNWVFIAFAMLDWVISSVRPGITYYIFGLYGAIKIATLYRLYEITESASATFLNDAAWTQFDQDMIMTVLFFWFGDRIRRRSKGNI